MLILASQSPARNALLAGAGLTFETRAANVNERELEAARPGDSPQDTARRLAEAKALAVALEGDVVIGADQTLAFAGSILHKPASLSAARAQLIALRGTTHALHAGVALAVNGAIAWSTVETATLTMRTFSEAELDAVLAEEGDAVLASVGGYRLEGPSVRLFETVRGDYFTILGLPLLPLLDALRTHAPGTLKGFT